MANQKQQLEERSISLITTEGKEIIIEYEADENIDDVIFEEVREAIKNNEMLCLAEYADCTIKFGNLSLFELDCKKIIGFNY